MEFTKLFSDEQLADIANNPNAHWCFRSIRRDPNRYTVLREYIDDITRTYLDEDVILKGNYHICGITAAFIEKWFKQDIQWLYKFYKWLSETSKRTNAAKILPLFLDTNGNAVPAFKNDLPNLFLSSDGGSNYPTVHDSLLSDSDTKIFLTDRIGIKEPSLKAEIYTRVFPQYDQFTEYSTEDDSNYFKKIFKYSQEVPSGQLNKYIEDLKKHLWLRCFSPKSSNDTAKYSRPQYTVTFEYSSGYGYWVYDYDVKFNLYIPSDELKEYFEAAGCGRFVDLDFYLNLVGQDKKSALIEFFSKLGLAQEVQYFAIKIDFDTAKSRNLPGIETKKAKADKEWYENSIEGCEELLEKIISDNFQDAFKKSKILWNILIAISRYYVENLKVKLKGKYFYQGNEDYKRQFDSELVEKLRTQRWLLDKNSNTFKSAEEITLQDIADDYDIDSYSAREVIDFLGIKEEPAPPVQPEDDPNLSDEQRDLIKYAQEVIAAAKGLPLEKIKQLLDQQNSQAIKGDDSDTSNKNVNRTTSDENSGENSEVQETDEKFKPPKPKITRPPEETQKEIADVNKEEKDELNNDNDDLTPTSVDYQKKIERLKKKSELEQEQLLQLEELQQKVLDSEKYSYGWFKACLELELLNSNEHKINSKEISISFGRVEREPNTPRTLILKYPSRFIPQFMEDLEKIPLNLQTKTAPAQIIIEVISVQHNTLRVKIKDGEQITNINFDEVIEATITSKNPVFLLKELRTQFKNLGYDDDFNMRENLCPNIEFVFGPPGTGKTTYLAQKVILPIMQQQEDKKILVLTPTNKAADVVTKKIMECTQNFDWLIRFGTTNDADIEEKVFYEKNFDIRTKPRNVTVTTIARFPYDFFKINGEKFLYELPWDYIIIDEASMIPLINIILPLYLKKPEKFIIAGDPFQIEPVISLDFWKDENIYTMVGLNSFTAPKTYPHEYEVVKLTTQYRSVPSIGEVFSQLTYGGILAHNRNENQKRPLNIDDWLDIKTLNIIKFPVSKYESVYRAKRINNSSSYQAYSAIFTFEFVKEMSRQISKNNPDKNFTIGIVAPYRVQADLIEKLFATVQSLPNIQISASTIHGFQGDECDIIFAVFNSPPSISDKIFLNRQNIINVSISRARDYLFLIMPENIEGLKLIKKVENLFGNDDYSEFSSAEIEKLIFGTENYIEENSFSTGHQSVNIYTHPERVYEIRSDDNAVDIQIHKEYKTSPPLATNLQDAPKIEDSSENSRADSPPLDSQNKLDGGNISGTNLTWTLDDEGTLTISGNGDMLHYGWSTENYWKKDIYHLIQKVIIEKGVTSIGDRAFAECPNLKEVKISDGVKKIGFRTFEYCGSLKKVEFPDSIEEISENAFFYCRNLEEINLPLNLITIGKCAFRGCYYLEKIKFSPNIQQIDDDAFSKSAWLKEVTLSQSIKKIGRNVFAECGRLEIIKYPRGCRSAEKLGEGNNAKLIPY